MATKRCPVCDVPVKLENLQRHVRNQHPRADLGPESLLSEEETRVVHGTHAASRPMMTRGGQRLVIVAAVVVGAILLIAIFYPRGGANVGQAAPDFALAASTGGMVTLSSYRGSVVLLEFMDVDCHFCQLEASVLRSVHANYSTSVRFLSVDVNFVLQPDTMERINAFKASYGTNWVYVLDATSSVKSAYGITGTPTTFIVDGSGVIRTKFEGQAPGGYAAYVAALDGVLQG